MQGLDAFKCIMDSGGFEDGYGKRPAIPNENSCSKLNDEFARNYCYLYGVWGDLHNARPTEGCDRITDKKMPGDWKDREDFFMGKGDIEYFGLDDLKAICLTLIRQSRRYR
jgi:hypothetical protein